ncbi:XRN 5'-3' exonuclease N-terminus-domain-containing protein [Dichotomocladium elegans]|nr:XRN 5'-3' exonuclease N-terminus-domain-containing protein [Dichotomocladium elegans]
MGIPKFFRWMSERYPMCSQLITQNRIPEFDNLYLDMNGIVHNCSHNNNDSAHYRISEEEIWIGIFNYVDHLFAKIKPKKLFFLAIDGVAPRAKMNQQRSRRFRTAKEAETNRCKAISRGEELPQEDPFDSNCITPGTEFMTKLTQQLRYFITKKVSEDANWRGVEIILSGPEVPGEGEHKIMEYIRLAKAQPEYNPNTRHCLYGLDADLIMLGSLSHDPHFALLREEVTFGRQSRKRKTNLETQNFYLMHLSLLREYLNLEFISLKDTLPFEYDLERIIDDFILLALFVGNDFLPNLPGLHIHEGALGLMFKIYKQLLGTFDGYLQDGGIVNFGRLQKVLDHLGQSVEKDNFDAERADLLYLAGKREGGQTERELLHELEKKKKGVLTITESQKGFFQQIQKFITEHSPSNPGQLHFDASLKARDRKFIENIARDFGLHYATEYSVEDNSKHVYIEFNENEEGEEDPSSSEDLLDEEAIAARDRVLAKYQNATVIKDTMTDDEINQREQEKYESDMKEWKRQYYMEKMGIDIDDKQAMDAICEAYVTGIQWVLHYYYNGVASWGWFYPYHYAPKITDLVNIERFQDAKFELGTPFKPYEQLMGVLPTLSRKLLPAAYQELMTSTTSPILDFYPNEFEMDLNGKKQDWEAIVKIPFIDEKRLLDAMKRYEHRLTKEERKRSEFGECYKFIYDGSLAKSESEGSVYASPLPGVFPDIYHCMAREEIFHLPTLENGLSFRKSLLEGAKLGKDALAGFPSLETIPYTSELRFHSVNVFQQESKNETMVVKLVNQFEGRSAEEIAKELLHKRVYVHYPYLQEAVVIGVSDLRANYYIKQVAKKKQIREHLLDEDEQENWRRRIGRVEYMSSKRFGLEVGKTEIGVHVCTLRGLKKTDTGAYVKEYVNPAQEDLMPLQAIVTSVSNQDARYMERPPPPISEEFPLGSKAFFLGDAFYGYLGTIVGHSKRDSADVQIITPLDRQHCHEPAFGRAIARSQADTIQYTPSYRVSTMLGIDALVLSKITSSLTIQDKGMQRVNLGLNLKFEGKQQKVLGYSRKNPNGQWEYSDKAIDLVDQYIKAFPKFIDLLRSKKSSGIGMLQVEDLIWTESGAKEIQRMRQWLKDRKVDELPRAPLTAEELEEPFVKLIEHEGTKYHDYYEDLPFKKVVIQRVPRNVLLKPVDAEAKLHIQKFKLGDRVVYALETGPVPLGNRGTVVGIQEDVIDVVFDTTFMGGKNLGGKCSDFRGISLPCSNVINLSYPLFAIRPDGSQHHNSSVGANKENQPHGSNSGSGGRRIHHSNQQQEQGNFRPRAHNGPNGYNGPRRGAKGHHNPNAQQQ